MPWFSRGERTSRRGELLESAVGPSTSLSGVIKSDGGLRIDGHFEGHIDVGGNVVVGEGGVVTVDVLIARNITIGGIVHGNIDCAGRLEILSSGQVVGDIVADAIMIDQGGAFQGASRMRTAMPALPAPAAPQGASPSTVAAASAATGSPSPAAAGVAPQRAPEPAPDNVIIDLVSAAPRPPAPPIVTPPPLDEADASTPADVAPPDASRERGADEAKPATTDMDDAEVAHPNEEASPPASEAPRADKPRPASATPQAQPTSKRANETSSRRADPAMDFALDIEPVIPDTGGGSASGAARQPATPATSTSDGGSRRNRRPSGGRRR